MRWNDTTERMNPGMKLDVDLALASWPKDMEAPTKRGLSDRFGLVKRQLKQGTIVSSLGQGSVMTPTLLANKTQPIPKTPRAVSRGHKSENSCDEEATTSSTDPITAAKGSSSNSFKRKLLGKAANPTMTNNSGSKRKANNKNKDTTPSKRKRTNTRNDEETDEPSMSNHDSCTSTSDESDSDNVDKSPSKPVHAASEGRRSLPRRSKSKTPARYRIEIETEDELGYATAEDGKVMSSNVVGKTKTKLRAEERVKQVTTIGTDEDETENSDRLFDPIATRRLERSEDKKQKAGWKERIAVIDDGDADEEVDMQD